MLALVAVLVCVPGPCGTGDGPFAELAFEAARERAVEQQKLLLVDFTASWCGPCKKMEKDTWAAAEVRAWLDENALAIQVDVDEERELAQGFRITAMPTVVALRAGEEFDRIVGYRDAPAFLAWTRDVQAGKRASDALLEESTRLRESTDVKARYELAQALARAGQPAEALVHYLWLWPATRSEPAFGGVRLSFLLSDMARLAAEHEPAREAFGKILAGLQEQVDAVEVPSFETWQEWTAFCRSFGENERVVAWYERHRDAEGRLLVERDDFLATHIVSEVFEVLMQAERPLDAVQLYEDATGRAREAVRDHRRSEDASAGMEADLREMTERFQRQKLVKDLSRLHAALLLAERDAEAARVATILLEALDTPEARIGLVREGLALVKRSHPDYPRWLDEAEAAGGNVRFARRELERLGAGTDAPDGGSRTGQR